MELVCYKFPSIGRAITDVLFKGRGKSKVVPVLLTEHHAMKAYWKNGGIAPLSL
jgi:hypothetical protein